MGTSDRPCYRAAMDAALAARGMPAVEAGHITNLPFIRITFHRLIFIYP